MRRPLVFALLLATATSPLAAATGPWSETAQAKVRLISGLAAAVPGAPAQLGIEFALQPHWHVYWLNAGDAGYPPELTWPEGSPVVDPQLRFPAPSRYDLPGDLVAFGYEDAVIYPVDGDLAAGLTGAAAAIAVRLDYLICFETCIPYRAELALELPLAAIEQPDAESAPRLATWRARLPRPVADAAGSPLAGAPQVDGRIEAAADGEARLVVEFRGAGLELAQPELFFARQSLVDLGRPRLRATAAGPAFEVPLQRVDRSRPLPERLTFDWTATGLRLGDAEAWSGRLDLPVTTAQANGPAAAAAADGRSMARRVGTGLLALLLLAFALWRRQRQSRA